MQVYTEQARVTRKALGTQPRRVRKLALLVHRYVGLVMTLFLVSAGLTGSVIVYYHELDATLNPGLYHVHAPSPRATPLDPLELRARLQAQLPAGLRVASVPLRSEPEQALTLIVTAPKALQAHVDNEYFMDPYDGRILGSRRRGDLTQGTKNLVPFLHRFHYSLALDKVGTYLMGGVALLWTLDCFVGAYLTLPPARKTRDKAWLTRWKSAWLLRANKLFALVFTWHRASGLWFWALLLMFAWSGVALNLYDEVYDPVMKRAFAMPERVDKRLPTLATPRVTPKLSWEQARSTARGLMEREARTQGFTLREERRISYNPARGVYRYQVRSSRDVSDRYPSTTLYIDGDSGAWAAFEAPTGVHAASTLSTWLYALHFGSFAAGGAWYRALTSFMGLAVALLSVSGTAIWWRKRRLGN